MKNKELEDLVLTSDPLPIETAPEYEYLQVEVSREQISQLYLKVPRGFRPTNRSRAFLEKAALANGLEDDDFECSDYWNWKKFLTMQSVRVIDEKEYNMYEGYEVKPEDIK